VAHDPPHGRCWTYTKRRFDELVAAGKVYWPRAGRGKPRLKRYQHESTGLAPFTIWTAAEVGENADAKKALLASIPGATPFNTPKPHGLLERIIHISTNPGDCVLDSFLGSGTTAIVAQRMGRRWIGIERNTETVNNVAIPLLKSGLEDNPSDHGNVFGRVGFTVLDVGSSVLAPDVRVNDTGIYQGPSTRVRVADGVETCWSSGPSTASAVLVVE
jgi:adenine-specific DNA-methyltransferase